MPEQDGNFASRLPGAAFDATEVLESMGDACCVLDHEWRFVYLNGSAERLVGRTRGELLGRSVWDEFPEAVGSGFESQYRRAVAEQVPVTVEEFYPPLGIWFEARAFPSGGGLAVFFRSVSDRRRTEQALTRSQEDLRLAIDAARLGTFYCDYPLDKIVWNDACKQHFFLPPDADVDFTLFYSLLHPDDREPTRRAIERAMGDRVEYDVEYRTLAADGRTRWVNAVGRFYYGPDGTPIRFDGVTTDISARKAAEEEARRRARRERFLTDLAERARGMTDPDAVIADAVDALGRFLGASRCVFADIDIQADTCTVPPDYRADEGVASIAGTFPISAFGAFVVAEYKTGRTAVVDDVRADPVKAPPESLSAYDAIGVRAYVAAPVMHSARLVSAIAVHSATPRRWEAEEVELIQAVVERAWLTVEVLRQQQALVREAEALREAHERTAAILEKSITDAFFALDADWRFTYLNDQAERFLLRSRSDLLGKAVWDEFPAAVGSLFEQHYRRAVAEQTAVTFEAHYPPPLDAWFEVRAFPSPEGLSVFFQNVNERKAQEAERERLVEREHRIATELQAALLPTIPERVPGLRFGHHYRAALQEAGIGGDFASVFGGDRGVSYLLVGDLSGKGLAAASQIATVTNMLQFAVHNGQSLAGAVTALNDTLADSGLLTGFATLFVGRYEAADRTLTYVNCGQDAGLVRRAAGGEVVTLPPTGPVLGAISGATYTEETVFLEPGDVLALYTDGLTEAGPTRIALLTGDGVADLLAGLTDVADAGAVVTGLIAGVDAHAAGIVSDDQCLLVAVVDG